MLRKSLFAFLLLALALGLVLVASPALAAGSNGLPGANPARSAFDPNNPCALLPGETGVYIQNFYSDFAPMDFTIGGGEWGTHDYEIPGDGLIYVVHMPPGRYTFTAHIPGAGSDHGERFVYQPNVCYQVGPYIPAGVTPSSIGFDTQGSSNPQPTPTPQPTSGDNNNSGNSGSFSGSNPCSLLPGESGVHIQNLYSTFPPMDFTIGGGEWGTHDYKVPGDGVHYVIHMPPGRYTWSAHIPGAGTAHGERFDYQPNVCYQVGPFSP